MNESSSTEDAFVMVLRCAERQLAGPVLGECRSCGHRWFNGYLYCALCDLRREAQQTPRAKKAKR